MFSGESFAEHCAHHLHAVGASQGVLRMASGDSKWIGNPPDTLRDCVEYLGGTGLDTADPDSMHPLVRNDCDDPHHQLGVESEGGGNDGGGLLEWAEAVVLAVVREEGELVAGALHFDVHRLHILRHHRALRIPLQSVRESDSVTDTGQRYHREHHPADWGAAEEDEQAAQVRVPTNSQLLPVHAGWPLLLPLSLRLLHLLLLHSRTGRIDRSL